MERRYEIIDKIIAGEIYLYIIFMFITKGEAVRNILLFSSLALWLSTLPYRKNRVILGQTVPLLFWGFIATILISVVFSLEPVYSFNALRIDPLKAVIIFCLISTTLSDYQRLKVFTYVSFALLLLQLSVGYYSYWVYDLPFMKPVTSIRHAWHARFAMDINTLLSFTFVIFLMGKNIGIRISIIATLIISISAILLSTSRGGIAAFICIAATWLIYLVRKYRFNVKMMIAGIIMLAVLAGVIINYQPNIRQRLANTGRDISTLTERTYIWKPLIAAASERPVFGWGYGPDIFAMDEPFKNTPYEKAPVYIKPAFRNPHNAFLKIFFHQGLVGVIFYAALLVSATATFWKSARSSHDFKSYMLLSCAGIMIGIYFVNSITENPHLTDLALILGIGIAAANLKSENSNN